MKPTRSLSGSRLSGLSRERRTALASLAALLLLLGSLVMYQRFTGERLPGPSANADQGPNQAPNPALSPAQNPDAAPNSALSPAQTSDPAQTSGPSPTPDPALNPNPAPAGAEPVLAPPPKLLLPLAGKPRVLKPYGYAFSDTYGDFRLHPWIDYAARHGEPVLAAAAGKVVGLEDDPAEGRMLTLEHPGGLLTRYSGLGKIAVDLNSTVEAGQTIGEVGDPGLARLKLGTQLGFSILLNGEPVDPSTYLSTNN